MVEPQITAGLRVPVGGWWTTRGGAWAKGERGRRYRLFDVSGARSTLAHERAFFERALDQIRRARTAEDMRRAIDSAFSAVAR